MNSLRNALIQCRDGESAQKIFARTEKSVIADGNVMNWFNDAERANRTLALYPKMKMSGTSADKVIASS